MTDERAIASAAEITACDQEPIHLAGSIQPHGFLLAVDEADGRVVQASDNTGEMLGRDVLSVLGRPLEAIVGPELARRVRLLSRDPQFSERAMFVDRWSVVVEGRNNVFAVVGHRHGGRLIVEGECLSAEEADVPFDTHSQIETLLAQLESIQRVDDLLQLVACETRRLTGFDRVLVYRFDPDWHGRVIAEDRNEVLPSYFDLHFPASDIPKQARDLYRLNRLRLIANAAYQPVRLRGVPGEEARPLDLSLSTLRSVSPVHREYMRNMGTGASLSISLIRDGELWGLISCHHREPRQVSFAVRTACALLGQVLSLQLAAREQHDAFAHRMRMQAILTPMVAELARHERLIEGVNACRDDLLRLMGADGAGVIEDNRVVRYGCAPTEEQMRALVRWLDLRGEEDVVAISTLSDVYPEAKSYEVEVSGVLALSVSRRRHSWVLWFRREVVETVTWGGDPSKPATVDESGGAGRLHPRKSFEHWKELVRGRALPWLPPEVETAREFRVAVVDIVLRGAERLAQLTEELTRTNKELESFSYTVSHDLRAPFRHIRSYAELLKVDKGAMLDDEGRLFLEYVLNGAQYAGRLVDNIIGFSRMGRTALQIGPVDLALVVPEVIHFLKIDPARTIEWRIDKLPEVQADRAMLFRVVQNLVENAVKFTRNRPVARIEVWAEPNDTEDVLHVRDNGVGFDERYKDKLFGLFQRLHAWEEFEGTGIGLASVRRIIARHGGRVWAASKPGEGSTFSFSLPKTPSPTNPLYA